MHERRCMKGCVNILRIRRSTSPFTHGRQALWRPRWARPRLGRTAGASTPAVGGPARPLSCAWAPDADETRLGEMVKAPLWLPLLLCPAQGWRCRACFLCPAQGQRCRGGFLCSVASWRCPGGAQPGWTSTRRRRLKVSPGVVPGWLYGTTPAAASSCSSATAGSNGPGKGSPGTGSPSAAWAASTSLGALSCETTA